jgi:hypothetical protein
VTVPARLLQAALLMTSALVASCDSAPSTAPPTAPPQATASPTASSHPPASAPSSTAQALTVHAKVDLGLPTDFYPNTEQATVADGSLWIPVYGSPNGLVLRIDLATHRVVARIAVGESPESIATAGGDVWVANSSGDGSRAFAGQNTLSRIDPKTNRIMQTVSIEIGGPIAGGFGAVWVPNFQSGDGNGTLRKVDARTGRLSAAYPLPGRPSTGCGHLWVVETLVAVQAPEVTVLSAVDPETGTRTGTWPLIAPGMADPQLVGDQCLTTWPSQDDSGTATAGIVDPTSGVVRRWSPVSSRLRLVDGAIWAMNEETQTQAISPDGTPVGPVLTLPFDPHDGPGWFIVARGEGWVITNTAALAIGRVTPG